MALRKYLKLIILSGLAILILWYFGRSLDWSEVGNSLSKANIPLLALAVFIICFGYLLRAFRWKTLLAPITDSDWRELFATTTIGFAAVFLFGRAGEVVRPLWLPIRDPRVRPSAALVTIGVERLCDLTAIILLFTLNLLWFRAPGGRDAEFAVVNRIGFLMLVLTITGIIALAVFQRFSAPISAWIETSFLSRKFVPIRVAQLAKNLLNNFVTSLQILSKPREFLLVAVWTALLWLSISIPTWLIILAFGVPFSFSDALFVMGWAIVGSLVPTPGGAAGAFHTATAGALIFLTIDRDTAAAVAIIMHLIYFAPALFFGIYYVLRGDVRWARIRSLVIADDSIRSASAEANESKSVYVLENARTRKS